jgi:predicted DNA binding protein
MFTCHSPSHGHSVLVHEDESEVVDAVVSFFGEGLESGEWCIYVGSEETQRAVSDGLTETGVDVSARVGAGDLSFRPPDGVYLEGGEFDATRTVELYEGLVDAAVSEGYDGVRIVGETGWIDDPGVDLDLDEWREYERRVDRIFRERPASGLCLYDRSRFSTELLSDVLCSHPRVTDSSDDVENIYYRSSPEFPTGTSPLASAPSPSPSPTPDSTSASEADSIDRMLSTLSRHRKARRSLPERKRHRYLESLNRTVQRANRPEEGETLRLPFDTIGSSLDASVASIWVYDEQTGDLERSEERQFGGSLDIESIERDLHEQIWTAFTDGSEQTFDETIPGVSIEGETRRLCGIILPVGDHGVFLVADTGEWTLSRPDRHLLETVAGIAESALDRREYESALEEKNAELQRRNERLRRLERVNDVFQRLSDVLLSASTRREILTAACEGLAAIEDVAFARVSDLGSDPEKPRKGVDHVAGDPDGYFDAIDPDSEAAETEPTRSAVEAREPRSIQNVRTSPPMQRWKKEALQRGVRSAIGLPLLHGEELHGVLTLYFRDAGVLDEELRGVFQRLAGLVARTINGIERKRALVGDRVTEIELRLHSDEHAVIRLVSELDCRFVLEGVVPADDGSFHVFAGVDAPPERLLEFVETSSVAETGTVVTEREEDYLYECAVSGGCFFEFLLEHNVVPKTLVADGESTRAVIDLPGEKSASAFMDAFRRRYPEVELVSKNQRERTVRTPAGFRAEIERSLTRRQLETLKTAYFGGYFEWPRDTSSEELAEMLGVTHPTVSRHLREAHRRVLTDVFDEG